MSFLCFIEPVEFIGAHTLLPFLFYQPKASTACANIKTIRTSGPFTFSHTKSTEEHIVFFWVKGLLHIFSISSPFGGWSPDPISSIADSPEWPGQQSPRRWNISIPRTVLGDRRICHRTWHSCSGNISQKAVYPLSLLYSLSYDDQEHTRRDCK